MRSLRSQLQSSLERRFERLPRTATAATRRTIGLRHRPPPEIPLHRGAAQQTTLGRLVSHLQKATRIRADSASPDVLEIKNCTILCAKENELTTSEALTFPLQWRRIIQT